jgi:hypothetical protein
LNLIFSVVKVIHCSNEKDKPHTVFGYASQTVTHRKLNIQIKIILPASCYHTKNTPSFWVQYRQERVGVRSALSSPRERFCRLLSPRCLASRIG